MTSWAHEPTESSSLLIYLLIAEHPISHLEAINALASIKMWAKYFINQLVYLYCDNEMVVTIFQAVMVGTRPSKCPPAPLVDMHFL